MNNKHSHNSSYYSFQYIELNEINTTNESIQQYIKPFTINDFPNIDINTYRRYNYKSLMYIDLLSDLIRTPLIKKRLIIVAILTLIIFINNSFGLFLPLDSSIDLNCINDTIFNITSSINNYFHYNLFPRYILTTISSLLIDFIFCYSLIDWALYYSGMRLVLCWAVFYITRGIIQTIYQMSFPPGFFWGGPVPSLIVSYLITNDFFFSGHVGMPLLTGLHYYHLGNRRMSILCFCTVFVEGFLVLITRVHYSIDVVVGLSFAHYVFIMVNSYVKYIDDWISGKREHSKIKDTFLQRCDDNYSYYN